MCKMALKLVRCLFTLSNAGSLPTRLSSLSRVLTRLDGSSPLGGKQLESYTLVALSYRGYWTSDGRPSQRGIERDAAAVLHWVSDNIPCDRYPARVTLWGQSIGAGIAMTAAADYLNEECKSVLPKKRLLIERILLETPFLSIREMLRAVYPQRWLPYRYLWPFLTNNWEMGAAMQRIAAKEKLLSPQVLILQAGLDELVPHEQGLRLERLLVQCGINVQRVEAQGCLHTEVLSRGAGQNHIVRFLKQSLLLG